MDLSWMKWPSIILIVALLFWVFSSAGTTYMYNKFTTGTPGQDAAVDERNEAGLTSLGNYLMKTLRYGRAEEVLQKAVDTYPAGKHYWHNTYRLVKLAEKRGDYEHAVDLLQYLIDYEAWTKDPLVPPLENLQLRMDKLIEVHELDT